MLLMIAATVSLTWHHQPTNTAGASPEPADEPIVLPFETGWVRQMDAGAEDGTQSCFADGEGDSFVRLAIRSCPPGSAGASEAQRRKPHRLGMEAITVITLNGDQAPVPPDLTFQQLSREEVELRVHSDGQVRSCRHVGGEEDGLCETIASGEFRFMPFTGTAERSGRMTRSAGLCHLLGPNSCGKEDK